MNHLELAFAGRLMGRWAKATLLAYPVAAPLAVWHQLQEGGPIWAAVLSGVAGPAMISAAIFMLVWFCLIVAMAFGWQPKS